MKLSFALLAGLAMTLAACKEETAAVDGCSKPAAYERAKVEVKRNLKSPSTAEFPPLPSGPLYSNGQVIIAKGSATCQFSVSAWVDAQNSFGAVLRQNFSVTLTNNPTSGDWNVNETLIVPR
jgi:hypothetical protein